MEIKPSKGLKIKVNASREAVFGDDGVSINEVSLKDGMSTGVMTGMTLAGFAEVEMSAMDGKKHWYPVGDLVGEKGEQIVEDEIEVAEEEDDVTEDDVAAK